MSRTPPATPAAHRPGLWCLQAAFIVLAGCYVYGPALRGGWLWDDNLEITQNPVFHAPGAWGKIWLGAIGSDYFPLKSSVQWLQWQLWQDNPGGYHGVSIGLHLLSALLVWRLLSKIGLRFAWVGGLLFAVHPIAVESVAWIAEQKNTTSLPLLLLSMSAFLDYDERGRRADHVLSLTLFLAAMLCKASVVMLPVLLLLHAWWKRGRIGWTDLKASAAFFTISLALGLVTIWFQHQRAIGDANIHLGDWFSRTVGAGLAVAFYLAKAVWPVDLLPVYPRWTVQPASMVQLLPWLLILAMAGWLWTRRATWGRHVILGLGFFLLNLAPVLGFVPMSYLRIAWVADHFAYLPLVGLIGLAVAGAGTACTRLAPAWRPWAGMAALVVVAMLAMESRGYARVFHDQETLWNYTLQRNPQAWPAHNNLGVQAFYAGRFAEAASHYAEAVRLQPDFPDAHFNLGEALFRLQHPAEAAEQFEAALKIRPAHAEAHNDLGSVLWQLGKAPEAIGHFQEAARLRPDFAEPHANLGSILLALHRVPEAVTELEEALRLNPEYAEASYNLGNALLQAGRLAEAVMPFERAVQLRPDFTDARNNLGGVLFQLGRADKAVEQFEAVLRLRPDDVAARDNLNQARALQQKSRHQD